MGYYNSFVVKVWSDEPGGKVRGHIQHVSSQESSHFLNLDKMLDFIISHLGPPVAPPLRGNGEEGGDNAIQELWNNQ